MERLLGMRCEEAMISRETIRGTPKRVASGRNFTKSSTGSLAHVEEGPWASVSSFAALGSPLSPQVPGGTVRKASYEEKRTEPDGVHGRGSYVDRERERSREPSLSLSSSQSIVSGGSKRRSWGSPKRFLERVKTKKGRGSMSPEKQL